MIDPIIGDNKARRICRKLVSFCGRWFPKHILYPSLIVLPPVVLTTIVLKTDPSESLGDPWGEIIKTWSPLMVIFFSSFYAIIIKAIYGFIEMYAQPPKELGKMDYLAVLGALEIVVAEKTKRMSKKACEVFAKRDVCAAKIFHQITQPDQQMCLLITGIHKVFECLGEQRIDYKLGLIRIEENRPKEWIAFWPHQDPAVEASVLSAPTSTVSCCIKSRKIVIVGDIQKELKKKSKATRRYLAIEEGDSDYGSQLCYPIFHPVTKNVALIITIFGNKANCLVEEHAELYEWVLNHFAIRLSMENSLALVKEKANEPH